MVHHTIIVVVNKARVVAEVNAVIAQLRYDKFFYPALCFWDSSCGPVNG